MRRDLIHAPQIVDDAASCADCGTWLPLDVAQDALHVAGGAVLDIGGLGSYCPTVKDSLGREAIPCSHPSAAAQSKEITVSPCPACQDYRNAAGLNVETCVMCGGSGMIGLVPDPDDPENPKILKVSGGRLSDLQMSTEHLSIKEAEPIPEFEKMVNRGAFQNWLSLRDSIRPPDVDAS